MTRKEAAHCLVKLFTNSNLQLPRNGTLATTLDLRAQGPFQNLRYSQAYLYKPEFCPTNTYKGNVLNDRNEKK